MATTMIRPPSRGVSSMTSVGARPQSAYGNQYQSMQQPSAGQQYRQPTPVQYATQPYTNGNGAIQYTNGGAVGNGQYSGAYGTAALPSDIPSEIPPSDIYQRALRVSSPQVVEHEPHQASGAVVRKKVIRHVEVPTTREVKVPIKTKKVIQEMVQQVVPLKRHVVVPSTQMVSEQYTDYEEKEAIRNKEIWVRQVVPEKYMVKVPVQRTRMVEKPTTVVREVEDQQTIEVPVTRVIEVDDFRIDTIPDSKVVEVEEYQDFEVQHNPVGRAATPHAATVVQHSTLESQPVIQQSQPVRSAIYDHAPLNNVARGLTPGALHQQRVLSTSAAGYTSSQQPVQRSFGNGGTFATNRGNVAYGGVGGIPNMSNGIPGARVVPPAGAAAPAAGLNRNQQPQPRAASVGNGYVATGARPPQPAYGAPSIPYSTPSVNPQRQAIASGRALPGYNNTSMAASVAYPTSAMPNNGFNQPSNGPSGAYARPQSLSAGYPLAARQLR